MAKETFVVFPAMYPYPAVYGYVEPIPAPQIYAYAPVEVAPVRPKVYGPYGPYTYGPY